MSSPAHPSAATAALMEGVNAVFESLGRALICLDPDFRVVHTSEGLGRLLGEEARHALVGRTAAEVLGEDLFGSHGTLRHALEGEERREGWGATLRAPGARPRLASITVAPLRHGSSMCDPRVAYVVVLRPTEETLHESGAPGPTLFSGLVARSPAMLAIFRLIENLGESEATVLVTGESGTGKELVARALHLHSPRREGPFVAVNCGALPADLLESELFGHVRGAFTGAVKDRVGRFELASRGTLFLDEIGEMPPHLQVKLLRVLQERAFEAVGDSRTRHTGARFVAATNLDLKRAVLDGRFRDDLYYRLRVVPIEVPPLRRRREDIEPLARHLLQRVGARHGRVLRLAPDALRPLLRYPWPGNVRELENALEYAMAVCQGETLHEADLPPEVLERSPPLPPSPASAPRPAPPPPAVDGRRVEPPEAEQLRRVLEEHRWHRAAAAAALGISRTTLWRRMRELGLMDGR